MFVLISTAKCWGVVYMFVLISTAICWGVVYMFVLISTAICREQLTCLFLFQQQYVGE